MTEATNRQMEVLEWIKSYCRARGMAPTLREIGSAFKVNVNCVQGWLFALVNKGKMRRAQGDGGGAYSTRSYIPVEMDDVREIIQGLVDLCAVKGLSDDARVERAWVWLGG